METVLATSTVAAQLPVHTYTVTLDLVDILNTRSAHTDTDYATFTLRITPQGGKTVTMSLTNALGDLATGVHGINLSFSKVKLNPTDQIIMNYIIINSGHSDPDKTKTTLQSTSEQLSVAGTLVRHLPSASALSFITSAMGVVAHLLSDSFHALFDGPNCDGTVAVEQEMITASDLANAAKAPVIYTTSHPGTDSPHGCGKNSVYEVTWSIRQEPVLVQEPVQVEQS